MTKQESIERLGQRIESHLKVRFNIKKPENLYRPIDYILGLGGKRIRPILTLMACQAFNGKTENALDAALAIEMFHNFSLVHDDIMDAAPLRRGRKTVHEEWDVNTGILSGDAMLIKAYEFFEGYDAMIFKKLAALFTKTAMRVCEGQQYDVDFETRNDVTIQEYLVMIEYKTAVLVAAAMKMGAIVAGADENGAAAMYGFGRNLGIAFQLQDDYLDAFGDPKTFGKQIGGDIMENKKTILFLKAMELAAMEQRHTLALLYKEKPKDIGGKVEKVKSIFLESGSVEYTKSAIGEYTQKAFGALDKIPVAQSQKLPLREFGKALMDRTM